MSSLCDCSLNIFISFVFEIIVTETLIMIYIVLVLQTHFKKLHFEGWRVSYLKNSEMTIFFFFTDFTFFYTV